MGDTQFTHWVLEAVFSYVFTEDDNDDHNEYDNITSFLDGVVTHLENDLSYEGVTVVLNEEKSMFVCSLLVPSASEESIETVVGKGMGAIRTAFHACNGHTPGWPALKEILQGVHVTPADMGANVPHDAGRVLTSV